MNPIDRFRQIENAKSRWTALGLPSDLSGDVVVLRDVPPEMIPEIREIAGILGIKRLTFFNLPSNGRRPLE